MLLFKYRSEINFSDTLHCNTARIFSSSSLYYAKPSTFNDPFDGRIFFDFNSNIEEAYEKQFHVIRRRARERAKIDHHVMVPPVQQTWNQAKKNVDSSIKLIKSKKFDYERYYRDAMDHFGAVALSAEKHNLLLWAHYANAHQGLCLGFDWDSTGLPPASEMQYSTSYRKTNYWAHSETELGAIALFQKSSEWAYEKEFRSINYAEFEWYQSFDRSDLTSREAMKKSKMENPDPADRWLRQQVLNEHTYSYKRVVTEGFSEKKFAKESLKEVIFGERMKSGTVAKHVHFIRKCGFNPVFLQATRNSEQFKIDFLTLNEFDKMSPLPS